MSNPGPVPPRDPRRDAKRIEQAQVEQRVVGTGIAFVFLQPLLALIAGGWAASSIPDRSGELVMYGAVGMMFALAAGYGVANGWRMIIGLLATVVAAPRLFRRMEPGAPLPNSVTATDVVIERSIDYVTIALHALVFTALAALLAGLLAWASPLATLGELWWRFAGAALLLEVFTPRVLQVLWP